jgi:hypothetical protein
LPLAYLSHDRQAQSAHLPAVGRPVIRALRF